MKRIAFSLVEIMVALIIVSCIAAAMAPVVTKKLKTNGVSIAGAELKMTCDKFGPSCGLCYPDKCVSCSKSCLENQALSIPKCACENCSDLHGINCLKCDTYNCSKCNAGYYVKDGKCEICPKGSYCDGTNKRTCDDGKYTDSEAQSVCKNCEAGFKCKDGTKSSCNSGTYSEANATDCLPCPKGYKCPGSSDKIQCSGAGYQPSTSKSDCLTCSAGSYVTADRASCVACEAGNKCSNGVKKACTGAYYQPNTTKSNCLTCNSGYYVNTEHTTCSKCSAGSYCDGESTKKCNANQYSAAGASSCSACWAHSTSAKGSSTCTCDEGFVANGKSCVESNLNYTFTGSYSETTSASGKQKIYLKSNGTFKSLNSVKVTLFLVGGGGGAGYNGGGGGGGGYINETLFTFTAGKSYSVTIGKGGPANGCYTAIDSGGTTKFGTFQALGGKPGGTNSDGTCNAAAGCNGCGGAGTGYGGNGYNNGKPGKAFDGEYFGGGGAGGGCDGRQCTGGKGGGGNGAQNNGEGVEGVAFTGGGGGGGGYWNGMGAKGGCGVVIILLK